MKFRITLILTGLILSGLIIAGCTKEVPKEMQNTNKQAPPINQQQQMPDDDIHKNLKTSQDQTTDSDTSSSKGDAKADKFTKEADVADAKYQKTKSEADKSECITKQLTAANYLMFEANLSPKKKYKPALQRYRRVLELDPNNAEAKENKQQIEEIYQSMGMQIPN